MHNYVSYSEDDSYFYRLKAILKNMIRLNLYNYINIYEDCGKKEYRSEYNDEEWVNKIHNNMSEILIKL